MFLVGTVYCKILWCCIEKKIYHTVNDKSCAYFVSRRLYCVLQLVLIFQYYTCCFYICITIGDPVIKRAVGIPLTGLTLPHFSVCPKPRPGFPVWYMYVVVVFVFSYYLRWEVIVCFVDIGWLSLIKLSKIHNSDLQLPIYNAISAYHQ